MSKTKLRIFAVVLSITGTALVAYYINLAAPLGIVLMIWGSGLSLKVDAIEQNERTALNLKMAALNVQMADWIEENK